MNHTDPTVETARALLYRHGLPEDVIDGALCLHAQELAAVQRDDAQARYDRSYSDNRVFELKGARTAADLIDPTKGAAASAVVSPPTNRAALAERLWQVAEHNIVAEWICCDPINPKHQLCVQGDATLRMVRALLVDDPKAAKPAAPLLDAILDVLPEPTDRAAVLDAAADHFDRMGRTVLAASQVRDELHRMAVEAQSCRWEHPHPGYRCEPRTAVEAHDTGTQQQVPQRAYPDCERCGDTGVDPERDGAEPCPECQQTNVPAPVETDEERADREATERDHARGDHTYCGITCEIEMPTEHLRNFVIAKGYPGTGGALDELLRRARAEVAEQQAAAEAWDVPDARPGTTDYTLQQQAAAADGEETP